MNAHNHHPEELETLVSLMLEGAISDEQFYRLQDLVARDDDARWYYITRVDMVGSVAWESLSDATLKEPVEAPDLLDLLDDLPPPPTQHQAPRAARTRMRVRPHARSNARPLVSFPLLIACVATSLLMLIGAILVLSPSDRPVASTVPPASAGGGGYAAKLVRAKDCVWLSDSTPPKVGDRLQTGQEIGLEGGMAEFIFDGGARVILQGPSTLRFDSSNQGTLLLGILTASVPEEAIGFSVESTQMKIIDLGTEFGITVAPSGAVQTKVFTGKVSVSVRKEGRGWDESQILEENALLSVDSQGSVTDQPIMETDYALRMPGGHERVAVRNPSFELPALPATAERDSEGMAKSHGEPVGWKIVKRAKSSSRNGCLCPLKGEFKADLPHGRQIGYTNRGEILSQVLEERCAPNTEYKLTVWVGVRLVADNKPGKRRSKVSDWPLCKIELLAGEKVIAHSDIGPKERLELGTWRAVELHVATPAEAAYVDQPLAIRLSADARSCAQINYDALELMKTTAK